MIDFFDYNTSPFNPALKMIVPIIFLIVFGIYLHIRQYYNDKIRSFIDMLMLFALSATLAGFFRFFGDGTGFGFTEDYSLKWLQSISYVFEAGFFLAAGYKLLHLFGDDENE